MKEVVYGGKTLDGWIEQLADTSRKKGEREQAAAQLADMMPHVGTLKQCQKLVHSLATAANGASGSFAVRVYGALTKVARHLLHQLNSTDAKERKYAAFLIQKVVQESPKPIPTLAKGTATILKACSDPDEHVKRHAQRALWLVDPACAQKNAIPIG